MGPAAIIVLSLICLATLGQGSALAGGVPAQPTLDQAYGDDPLQRLDAYPVAPGQLAPAVVVVHGGGWFNGDKSGVASLAESLSADGFAVFNINYRLAIGPPGAAGSVAGVPMQANDIALAVDWVHTFGAGYGADVSHISLIGGSSGAQLVALAGQLINAATPGRVRSVVEMSGPMDFYTMVHPDGATSLNTEIGDGMPSYLGCPVADCTDAQLNGPSPINNIREDNPAFLLVNGDAEMNPMQQATVMHDALIAAGESSILNIVTGTAGTKHGFSLFPSQETQIVQFLRTAGAPTLTIGDVSQTEGSSDSRNMTFSVTLTGVNELNRSMTVDYSTGDGTAAAGSDYAATTGTLTFATGPTTQTQTFTVAIYGDTLVEADETFSITLSRPVNTTISDAQAQGTIVSDDIGDTTPPTVVKKTPAANAKGSAVGANVTATFSEPVSQVSNTTFTLTDPAGTLVPAAVAYSTSSRVATLDPTAKLAADTWYTASLTGGTSGIQDASGVPLVTTTWQFLTGPKPKVTAKSPASGATAVARSASVMVTFNEPVNAVTDSTFTLSGTAGAVIATVTRNGTTNQWVLDPTGELTANTRYTVTLTGGPSAIRDLAGNPLATTSWIFTTGT